MDHEKEFSKILLNVRKCMSKAFSEGIIGKTKNGDTQVAERTYIGIIRCVLQQLGYVFQEASSQQPYDFRIQLKDNSTLLLECKKTDGKTVYFNDTCPSEKAFYIIVFTGKESKREEVMPNMSYQDIKKQLAFKLENKYPNVLKKTTNEYNKIMKINGFDSNGYTGRTLCCWKLQWLESNGTISSLKKERREGLHPCVFGVNGGEFIKFDSWIINFKTELNALKEKYRHAGKDGIMSVYPRPTYKANISFLFKIQYETAKIIIV